jgi:hypothetical protein
MKTLETKTNGKLESEIWDEITIIEWTALQTRDYYVVMQPQIPTILQQYERTVAETSASESQLRYCFKLMVETAVSRLDLDMIC